MLLGEYSNIEPNLPIPISQEEVEVECNDNVVTGQGSIELSLLPSPSVQIHIDFPNTNWKEIAKLALRPRGNLRLPQRNISDHFIFSKRTFGSEKPLHITALLPGGSLETNPRRKISYIIFYLVNYWNFISPEFTHTPKSDTLVSGNRLNLETDDWRIVIESLSSTSNRTDILKNQGGYGITHIGKIERIDNKTFTPKAAKQILEALFYFLSFSRGFWVHPILPIGYNKNNEKVWELWANYMVSPWKSVLTWCDHHNISFLSEIFAGFIKRWHNQDYQESIRTALYWYIRSNVPAAGTDGSIILTQAALERLSWDYHVNIKNSLSLDGFERLSAGDRIKLILSHAGIPLSVPNNYPKLASLAKERNLDGPALIAYIRNRIVHPGRQKGKIDPATVPLFECWNLGLWYLELLLLFIFEYSGDYANRLRSDRWVGQTEKVPWYNSE